MRSRDRLMLEVSPGYGRARLAGRPAGTGHGAGVRAYPTSVRFLLVQLGGIHGRITNLV